MMHSAYGHDHDPPTSFFTCNIQKEEEAAIEFHWWMKKCFNLI